jgi:hypothetical protein
VAGALVLWSLRLYQYLIPDACLIFIKLRDGAYHGVDHHFRTSASSPGGLELGFAMRRVA